MRTRLAGLGIIGVAVLVLAWASVAFACTVQPQVRYSLLPESAEPGSAVMVEGRNLVTESPVEIRWDGVGGQVLAEATPVDGALSVPVQVPDVAPGVYSLMLVTENAGVGRTAFEVTGAAGDAPAPVSAAQLWPSPTVGLVTANPAAGPSLAGVALLAVGLVGLFAGSAVAVTRRRRALVEVRR